MQVSAIQLKRPLLYAIALAFTTSLLAASAQAAPQWAYIEKLQVNGNTLTLTLNYVDFFGLDGDPVNEKRAMQVLGYKSRQEMYDANPSGYVISDKNPKLRTFKTDAKTVYELVCLREADIMKAVPLKTFVASYNGNSKPCWPFDAHLVWLELSGGKVVRIGQQYLP